MKVHDFYGVAEIKPTCAVLIVTTGPLWSPLRCWLSDMWEDTVYPALLFALIVTAIRVMLL